MTVQEIICVVPDTIRSFKTQRAEYNLCENNIRGSLNTWRNWGVTGKGRLYERLSVLHQNTEEAAGQREQNRLYMQRFRASQTPEEVERPKEKTDCMNSCLYYDELFSIMHSTGDTAIRKAEAFLSLSGLQLIFSVFCVLCKIYHFL